MNIKIDIAQRNSQQVLAGMLSDYLRELGVDAEYPYLPLYWEEPGRFPYFILVDEKVAGFALVRTWADAPVFEMAEFGVLNSYRGLDIGRQAAHALFAAHPGRWRVTVMPDNAAGLSFWRSVVPVGTPVVLNEESEGELCLEMLFSTAML